MEELSNDLQLKNTDESSSLILDFLKEDDAGQFLSEKNLYPDNTVTSLSFLIFLKTECIGFARIGNIRWYSRKAELTIFIARDHRRKGYGRKAMYKIIEMAFSTFHFHRLEAELYEYNLASRHLVEESGFKPEGCLREARYYNGKYFDILRYGLLDSEYKAPAGSD